ncbi:exodeoxyribonuclease VII small subunit [bacterium]|nr:exodeoxyribonuclease VII small subunit [bacterium]
MIEKDIKALDELVKKMESDELPLEEALETFKKGVELVKKCNETLENAELRVKEILEGESGDLSESDL